MECRKDRALLRENCALRSAGGRKLFASPREPGKKEGNSTIYPPKDGKDAQRPSKYPVNDGINYEGIDSPTPVKQILTSSRRKTETLQ